MTTPAGATSYSYDQANRLVGLSAPGIGSVGFVYDNRGNQVQRTLPDGIALTYTYDALNRLTNLAEQRGTTTLASYAYTLDPVGNRTKVSEAGGTTVQWAYDDSYRLTGETTTSPSGQVTEQSTYAYDPVGNRTGVTTGGQTTTYTYNTLDRRKPAQAAVPLRACGERASSAAFARASAAR